MSLSLASIAPPHIATPTSWWRTFFLPFRHLVQFRGVGQKLPQAPISAFLCSYAIGASLIGLLVAAAFLPETERLIGARVVSGHRSIAEIMWDLWFGVWLALLLAPLPLCLGTFLMFPDAYRSGRISAGLSLSAKAVMSQITLVILFFAVFLSGTKICSLIGEGFSHNVAEYMYVEFSLVAGSVAFWLVVLNSRRLLLAANDLAAPVIDSILCEHCGYDVTHAERDSICPECGQPIKNSIAPASPRCCMDHSADHNAPTGGNSTADCLLRPSRFYQSMQLRSGLASAIAFARRQFPVMGIGAGAWIFLYAFFMVPIGDWWNVICIAMGMSIGVPMAGWLIARGVASLVALAWGVKGLLRDNRWLAKVARYETAYLWVFCAFNGCLITTYLYAPKWPDLFFRTMLGIRAFGGGVIQPILLLSGNALLVVIWFLRYRIILRAIQWSNY